MDNEIFDPLDPVLPDGYDEEFLNDFEKFLDRFAEAIEEKKVDGHSFLAEISDRLDTLINMREIGP